MLRDEAVDSLPSARRTEIEIAPKAEIAMVMKISRHLTTFVAEYCKVLDTGSIGIHKIDYAGWKFARARHVLG